MTFGQQIAKGAAWLFIARAAGQVLGLASTIVVARFVTPDDYGVFAAAMSLMIMVSVFAEFPVGQAIIQLPDANEDDYDTAFTLSILRAALIAALLLLCAPLLASFVRDERVEPVIFALSAYVLILGLRNPRLEWFARSMDFSKESYLEFGSKLVQFIAAVSFAFILQSYWALVIAIIMNAGTQVVVSFALKPKLPRITLASFRRLFGYSVWMAGNSIIVQIYQLIDTLTLGRLAGSAALGAYSMGGLIASRVSDLLSVPAARPLFAAISQIQNDLPRLARAVLGAIAIMTFLLVPVSVTLFMLAAPIIMLLLGPNWVAAIHVSQAFALIALAMITYTPLHALLTGTGRTRLLFLRTLVFVIFYLPLTVWAVSSHGLEGLLLLKTVMVLGMALIDGVILRNIGGVSLLQQVSALARPVAGGSVMMVAYLLLAPILSTTGNPLEIAIPLVFIGAVGSIGYLVTVLIFWRLSGRPDGIEKTILELGTKLIRRLRPEGAPG